MSNQEHLAAAADLLERYLRWEGDTTEGVVYLRGLLKTQLELHLEPILNLLKESPKCTCPNVKAGDRDFGCPSHGR